MKHIAKKKAKAVMTVFFALLSTLFLGVLFIMAESLRYQGVRAQAQQITDMGNYSVFGEFERKLLTDFDIFAVDGAYGTGDFSIDRVRDRFKSFMQLNTQPTASGLSTLCFDPWKISISEVKAEEYTLLSDGGGEAFYQQVVELMRKTAIMNITGKLLDWYRDAEEAQEKQKTYEQEKNSVDKEMEELEQQEAKKREELEAAAGNEGENAGNAGESAGIGTVQDYPVPAGQQESAEKIENPIPALRRLRRKDILTITCGNAKISETTVKKSELASKRSLKKGTLAVKKKYGGLVNNLIFREYLLDRFGCFGSEEQEAKLKYELEYILCGKTNDRANLKAVIYQLLLLREGCNYLFCSGDERMSMETGVLATALIGWTGIPALTAILKHALLLGWAYAESLLDVRGLMEGKKIPLFKDEGEWTLSLANLAKINELLDGGGNGRDEGLSYKGYLRILFNLQSIAQQKKRALDTVELRVKSGTGLSGFQTDHCVVAMKEETTFTAPALFSRVTGAFMGLAGGDLHVQVSSGFAYLD